ncbi:MAG TPA: hypothetical protein VIW94_09390 [Acidimicrobiia bacterium]
MKNSTSNLHRSSGLFIVGLLLVAMGIPLAASAADNVVLCHNGHTIEISVNAVYGRNGHLNSDGSSQPGHDGDHLGACFDETTSTTSPQQEPTTTTTEEPTTTTTEGSTTSTLGVEVDANEQTTSTTDPEFEDPDTNAGTDVGGVEESTTSSQPSQPASPQTDNVAVDSLPFTGVNGYLVVPGIVLMAVGLATLLLCSGIGIWRRGRYEER